MPNTVITLKKSSLPGSAPTTLANGELALNYADGKLYYKQANGDIAYISAPAPAADAFGTVNASGTLILADTQSDVLNLVAGDNVLITANALTDTITISATGNVTTTDVAAAFNQANTARTHANSAFNKANNALANTTGTFEGALSVKNDLILLANLTFGPYGDPFSPKLSSTGSGDILFYNGGRNHSTLKSSAFGSFLGIGTDSPSWTIQAFSNAQFLSETSIVTQWGGSNTGVGVSRTLMTAGANASYITADFYRPLILQTGTQNRVTIDETGNVAIGTANAMASLHVPGSVITGRLQHHPVPITPLLFPYDPQVADYDYFASTALNSDGSVLVVGSPYYDYNTSNSYESHGTVYTYYWNGSQWVQRGNLLIANDYALQDNFGYAVAINSDGNLMAVGAPNWSDVSGINNGGVYIFNWNYANSTWTQRGSVLSPLANNSAFGASVSMDASGNTIVVGTYVDKSGTFDKTNGSVYTYDWNGTNWNQRGNVITGTLPNTKFGLATALSRDGNVLFITAPFEIEDATGNTAGAIHVYDRSGNNWIERSEVIVPLSPQYNSWFSCSSVATDNSGSVLVTGHPQYSLSSSQFSSPFGALQILDLKGNTWEQRGDLLFSANKENDTSRYAMFGYQAALTEYADILVSGIATAVTSPITTQDDYAYSLIYTPGAVATYSLTGAKPGSKNMITGSGWVDEENKFILRTGGQDKIAISTNTNSNNIVFGSSSANVNIDLKGTLTLNNNLELDSAGGSTNTIGQLIATSFSKLKYRGAKFIVIGKKDVDTHITEILITHNMTDAMHTEYGAVYTNGPLFTITSDVSGDTVRLLLTPNFTNFSYEVMEQKFIENYQIAVVNLLDVETAGFTLDFTENFSAVRTP